MVARGRCYALAGHGRDLTWGIPVSRSPGSLVYHPAGPTAIRPARRAALSVGTATWFSAQEMFSRAMPLAPVPASHNVPRFASSSNN